MRSATHLAAALRAAPLIALLAAGGSARAEEPARAEDPDELAAAEAVERAREAFGELDYEEAIEAAEMALADPGASASEELEALELLGLSHVILGDDDAAAEAFSELLAIDPHYELTEETGSPKIREVFEDLRRDAAGAHFAELVHAAPASARAGGIAELDVAVGRGAGIVEEVVIAWRERGEGPFREARFRRRDRDEWATGFSLPASKQPWVLEYYLEARDGEGEQVGRVGAPDAPLSFPVAAGGAPVATEAEPTPWYRRWYVVGAGAAALGAAGVAVGVAVGGGGVHGSLDPGRVTLSP